VKQARKSRKCIASRELWGATLASKPRIHMQTKRTQWDLAAVPGAGWGNDASWTYRRTRRLALRGVHVQLSCLHMGSPGL